MVIATTDSAPHLRLEVVQFHPRKNRVEENLERIRTRARDAAGSTDLLLFPETALSGYFVEGGVEEVARSVEGVRAALGPPPAQAPDLVLGMYERDPAGVLRNAAVHLAPAPGGEVWEIVHLHRKVFLPTYTLFDEARFVRPGTSFRAYDTRFGRMGLLICEEMLHSLPPTLLALDGAELLLALSASPARDYRPGSGVPGSMGMWELASRAITLEHSLFLALAQPVGSEGGKLFAGGCGVYGPGGEVLGQAPAFEETVLRTEVPLLRGRLARTRSPMLEDLRVMLPHLSRELERVGDGRRPLAEGGTQPGRAPVPGGATGGFPVPGPHTASGSSGEGAGVLRSGLSIDPTDTSPLEIDGPLLEKALVTFLRDEVTGRRGMTDVVVGVSGGVDSAVTLALAARAFGPDRVHAFLLPYATSSDESRIHGELACRTLGVEPREIEITTAVNAYLDRHEPDLDGRRRGNLAARMRAMILWDQSARVGGIVLGTGNKSERLLGYFTWHADDSPPVNPLGDLLKTQVFALARHLEVPEPILAKPPSADLVEGVHDEDELGVRYAQADLVLHWLLAGIPPEALRDAGFEDQVVNRVHQLVAGTHWKRRLPTTAVVSGSAIGEFWLRPVDF